MTSADRGRSPRLGLVGCGRWGRNILRDLLELGCSVVVIDVSRESRAAALDAGAAAARARLEELDSVDGVIVATPARTHEAILETLLERNAPIFCEKPLTADASSAARLAAKGAGRLFVMDKWRYHPGVEALGSIARSGELGAARAVRTLRISAGSPAHDVDAVWTLAPHDLSIVREIVGFLPEPQAAWLEQDGDEAFGLSAVLGEDPFAFIEVSVRRPVRRREVRLECAEGTAVLQGAEASHIEVGRTRRAIPADPPLHRELEAFLRYLRGGEAPRSTAAEGAETIEVLSALREMGARPGARERLRKTFRDRGFDATA